MSEFYQVRKEDWDHLNSVLRLIQNRLDALDSAKAAVQHYNDIDMGGHQITGGPASQLTAADADFITKQYLRSKEAADIMRDNLRAGGKAPLLPAPTTT